MVIADLVGRMVDLGVDLLAEVGIIAMGVTVTTLEVASIAL